jgi:hypothetical protein
MEPVSRDEMITQIIERNADRIRHGEMRSRLRCLAHNLGVVAGLCAAFEEGCLQSSAAIAEMLMKERGEDVLYRFTGKVMGRVSKPWHPGCNRPAPGHKPARRGEG